VIRGGGGGEEGGKKGGRESTQGREEVKGVPSGLSGSVRILTKSDHFVTTWKIFIFTSDCEGREKGEEEKGGKRERKGLKSHSMRI